MNGRPFDRLRANEEIEDEATIKDPGMASAYIDADRSCVII